MIKVLVVHKNGFIYHPKDVEVLRKQGRIVGKMIGPVGLVKKAPCDEGTLPLLFSPEEITLALSLGLIECCVVESAVGEAIVEELLFSGTSLTIPLTPPGEDKLRPHPWTYPQSPLECLRCSIFNDLHSKKLDDDFFLTDGMKFGGDWLAYPGDPLLYHAQFIVKVLLIDQVLNPLIFVATIREAHSARKHLLLAFTTQDLERIRYEEIMPEYMTVAPYDGFAGGERKTKGLKQKALVCHKEVKL